VQRTLANLYSRSESAQYLIVAVSVAMVVGLATLAVAGIWSGRYLRLSFAQVTLSWCVAAAFAIPAALLCVHRSMDLLDPLMRWSKQRSPERAVEAWTAAVRVPTTMGIRVLAVLTATAIPAAAVETVLGSVRVWTGVGLLLAGLVALGAALVVVAFGAELALRPVLEDIVPFLPPGFEPSARVPRLGTKAFVPLLPVTLFSALTAGAFLDRVTAGPLRLALALAIGIGSVAVAGVIFSIVMRAVLHPLSELVAATRRVSQGDIETPVPLVSADELGTLASTFNQMLASLRAHERELRAAQARIVASADEARRRVERDLHDGAQQRLVLVGLKLGLAERQGETDPAAAVASLKETRAELDVALDELRDLAHGIYPQVLESEGIAGALRDAVERTSILAELESDGCGRYPAEIEAAVYFCCLEALQNAAKHAGATAQTRIRLADHDHTLEFEVSDNGGGFDSASGKGSGVQNMSDRIGALGGKVSITSARGAGTKIIGTVPLNEPAGGDGWS
jgi:signal transduction histidine kinase